ncbi:MAG: DUF4173 domain-containing protein [Propionibacteriaceae bacterium]|jgi:hypothetical protein|nr:DUF4173 domain-containing protein [Propionibacteriaceae bacterium]
MSIPTLPPPPAAIRGQHTWSNPPFPSYQPPLLPLTERFLPLKQDVATAVALFAAGYFFFEWGVPVAASGATVFYLACLGVALPYLHWLGIRQTRKSWLLFALAVAGALRFTVFDVRSIDWFLLHPLETGLCVLWVATACGNAVAPRFGGHTLTDMLSQLVATPVANYTAWFASAKAVFGRRAAGSPAVKAVGLSLLVCLPLFIAVGALLAAADRSFADLLDGFAQLTPPDDLGLRLVYVLGAAPVAAYIFAILCGNGRHHRARQLTAEGVDAKLAQARLLPQSALAAPLAVLAGMYAVFFAAMGTYLFSAFAGALPSGFTYAEYARRGFFELCGVAVINLAAVGLAYLLARRPGGVFPVSLRVLTGSISALTCLLIATAVSKMLLYTQTYGMSQLRLYVLWFLVLMLAVFGALLAWHIRPGDVSRPIAWAGLLAVAALAFADTDAIIANHNVDRYLAQGGEIDVAMIRYELNDGALPALERLAVQAPDPRVRSEAQQAYAEKLAAPDWYGAAAQFPNWNAVSALNR